ncbi:triple tyrosine motif-containing protein, partial [Shewanella sp. CG12_big_fil_rev_8_21_14_0_65_47_15]|uniref:triple tyrosine motif-containing protein n=1 Tax=Shewanella sp. CG12_big_fil_rev_8_21_14_0_65_47_15 TaxID=1975537 RepID=UPI000CB9DF16
MPKALLKIVLLVVLCISAFENVSAFPFSDKSPVILQSQSFGVPQGLSQSTVTSIVQDHDGYIWIGTLNGLNRFDGREFKHFYADDKTSGLPSSFIRSLLITSDGGLLVGTDKGLVIYNKESGTLKNVNIEDTILNNEIWSLSNNDFTGEVLVGTNTGLTSISLINKKSNHVYLESNYFEVKKSLNINSEIFIKTYDGKLQKITQNKKQIISTNVLDIEKSNNSLYVSKKDGFYKHENGELKKSSSTSYEILSSSQNKVLGISKNKIYSVSDGEYLLGKTLEDKEKSELTYFTVSNSLILVGLNNHGFEVIRNSNNLIFKTDLIKDNVWHISNTPNGNILVSSDETSLNYYDKDLKLLKSYDSGIGGYKNSVMTSAGIYIGNNDGIRLLKPNGMLTKFIDNEQITTLNSINNTNKLIAGTADGKILFINENGISHQIITEKKDPIFEILYLSNENIYIAGQNGVYHYSKNSLSKIYNELTYSIKDYNDSVLFGTSTAIVKYNKNNKSFNEIFSNNKGIYSIVTIGNMIFASSQGQIILLNNGEYYILSTINGSQFEYNTPSGNKLDSNYLLFGGIDGLSLISKDEILSYLKSASPPKTELSELRVFNLAKEGSGEYFKGSLNTSKEIKLKYSDYPFSIAFNSPFSEPNSITYYYKMDGLSNEWIASNNVNSATYTNLSAGEYTFKVYAVDNLTHKNGPIKNIQVVITPPWWLSIKAKTVYFIIMMIIILGITKSILRKRAIQRQIALSEERLKLSLWGSGDEMWDWDIETGNIFRSNIWGALEFPRDGHRSGKSDEESNIHPMDQERVREALNKHFYGETDHFEAAYRVKGKDDHWIWILDRAKIVERDDKDNALRMTGRD